MSMIPDEPSDIAPRSIAQIGDNRPPSMIEDVCAAQRAAQTSERRERLEYIVQRALAKTVIDRETAGQAGDIIKTAGLFIKTVESDRIELTRPYRDAADAGKAVCDEFLQPLHDAVEALRLKLKAWTDAEDERIEQQQAEQEAFFRGGDIDPDKEEQAADIAERRGIQPRGHAAEIRAANLKPARRRKIVGDLGSTVSAVERKVYRVIDPRAVPDVILNSKTVTDAIVQVAKSLSRHMETIDGIEITTETDNQIR